MTYKHHNTGNASQCYRLHYLHNLKHNLINTNYKVLYSSFTPESMQRQKKCIAVITKKSTSVTNNLVYFITRAVEQLIFNRVNCAVNYLNCTLCHFLTNILSVPTCFVYAECIGIIEQITVNFECSAAEQGRHTATTIKFSLALIR